MDPVLLWHPTEPTVHVGDKVFMTWATGRSTGRKAKQKDVAWSSSDSTVATVRPWPGGCYAYAYCAEVVARHAGTAAISIHFSWGTPKANPVTVVSDLPASMPPAPSQGRRTMR